MADSVVKADAIFGDHMVLQQGRSVPVWGTGADGQRVEVECAGCLAKAVVSNGSWRAELPPLEAGGPYELLIRSDDETIVFRDVLVGEVWLAGGQSNMQWPLNQSLGGEAEIVNSGSYPTIRYYDVPKKDYEDGIDRPSGWKVSSPEHAGDFSAVAYHFAKQLLGSLHTPIGIVGCNMGATSASCWVSEARLREDAELRVYQDEFAERMKDFDWAVFEVENKQFHDAFDAYNRKLEEGAAKEELGLVPWPPPLSPRSFMRPNGLYETMFRKAAPYGIKGVIYYQGESDVDKSHLYDKLLETLIDNWREDLEQERLPFLFAQISAFGCDGNPGGDAWALLREAQANIAARMPNTGMAITLDCGEEDDIHPRNKATVGERLALLALNRVYGRDVPDSGPVFKQWHTDGNKALLRFDHAGSGLGARGAGPIGFELCGEDGAFVPAEASIDGDSVILWSKEIAEPHAARYGWANYTEANLVNSFGLPAGSFRTHSGRAN